MKKERGITLVALIITIIILLILAVVTISAVNEGNLFAHANNAATKWSEESAKENTILSNMISEMEKYTPKDEHIDIIGKYYLFGDDSIETEYMEINSDGSFKIYSVSGLLVDATYEFDGESIITISAGGTTLDLELELEGNNKTIVFEAIKAVYSIGNIRDTSLDGNTYTGDEKTLTFENGMGSISSNGTTWTVPYSKYKNKVYIYSREIYTIDDNGDLIDKDGERHSIEI